MRNHFISGIIILVLGTVFSADVFAEGDTERGEAKYKVCIACHGENGGGRKITNAPRIAGQQSWYLARQLKNFKMVFADRIMMILPECKCVRWQ